MDYQDHAKKISEIFSEDLSQEEQDLIKNIPQIETNQRPIIALILGNMLSAKILRGSIKSLNESIRQANESSTKLTTALNRITLTGIIIAALSLLVVATNVVLEYWKFFHPTS
jgi:hypothetical protein